MSGDADVDRLLALHLDGGLSADEEAALVRILRERPEELDRLIACERLDRLLVASLHGPVAEERMAHAVLDELRRGPRAPTAVMARVRRAAGARRRLLRAAGLAAAALVVALGAAFALLRAPAAPPRSPAGEVVVAPQPGLLIARAGERRAGIAGEALAFDDALLLDAAAPADAEIALRDGTRLRLRPGCRLRLGSQAAPRRLRLDAGELEASVTRVADGAPFAIASDVGETAVLGTRFVLARDGGTLRLDVIDGVVELRAAGAAMAVAAGASAEARDGGPPRALPPLARRTLREGLDGWSGTADGVINDQNAQWTGGNGTPELRSTTLLVTIQPDYRTRALLRFAPLSLPHGARLRSATLVLGVECWDGPTTLRGRYLRRSWNPAATGRDGLGWLRSDVGIPWAAPGASGEGDDVGGPAIAAQLSGRGIEDVAIPLAVAEVQAWIDDPARNHGIVLATDAPQRVVRVRSSRYPASDARPALELVYRAP